MLKSCKLILVVAGLLATSLCAQEQQSTIKIDTKIKNESEQKKTTVFSIDDNSTKFKVDPAEVNKIKTMDIQAVKEKIEMMRDKVLDSKSKLIEVSGDELGTNVPLSYISVTHENKMSSRFNIVSLKYLLDGKGIYSYYNSDGSLEKKTYSVYSAFVAPGHHEVVVEAVVSGSGNGMFDYLKDYRVKVQDRFAFVIPDKKKVIIAGFSYEKGGIFTSFKERPGIKFNLATENKIAEKIEK